MLFRLDLCERLGMTLAGLDTRMGAGELVIWKAKAELDGYLRRKQDKGLSVEQALEHARADHRASVSRRGRR